MANITNRSPWLVKLAGQDERKFRSKPAALAYLASIGHNDPAKLPKGALKQPDTAFEVQIKLVDSKGNEVKRSATLDTMSQAQAWASVDEAFK